MAKPWHQWWSSIQFSQSVWSAFKPWSCLPKRNIKDSTEIKRTNTNVHQAAIFQMTPEAPPQLLKKLTLYIHITDELDCCLSY